MLIMKELTDKQDFHWYKQDLDLGRRYEHKHYGEPEKYPCLVQSEWEDDPNGPYTYRHYFIYQKTDSTKCSECGHVTTVKSWDYAAAT